MTENSGKEKQYAGVLLITKEMSIQIAGLAHTAQKQMVVATQVLPPGKSDPRIYPIEIAKISRDGKWHERWEISPYPNVRPVLREKEGIEDGARKA